ncbi:uncharacterized protein LOC124910818 isoform X2 [Impatiens glandulifera]|uniref:uncharacterized protein LOC124910818 isoform X2 n=1 Tax=Impatiens glandulifera TaxID=253017 RepID=UPI001FB1839D|nr:uncharacterized protein LOC124910818 isoform X2 [Impatiens glandulifera]
MQELQISPHHSNLSLSLSLDHLHQTHNSAVVFIVVFHTLFVTEMISKERQPETLDFFIWTVEDVGLWLEEINLGSYRQIFKEIGVNGEYLESMSMFTTEQILRFIRRCHMKWGDFITLCKELRRIKVACLKGEQRVRRPWWAPPCLAVVFVKSAKSNRQARVVSLKLEP